MKAKIRVSFSSQEIVKNNPIKEDDSLEIEIEYENEKDLEMKIEYWQDFIQKKVISATYEGVYKYSKEREKYLEKERKLKETISVLSDDEDEDETSNIKKMYMSYKKSSSGSCHTNSSSC